MDQEIFNLKDRVAIVTGATSGIGRAVAVGFANFGANIVVVGRDLDRAKAVSGQIEKIGRKNLIVRTDVVNPNDVTSMVNRTLDEFGRIDILVNAAGIARIEGSAEDLSEQDWDDTMSINLKGTFLCAKAVAPSMIKQKKGKIINFASTDGIIGVPHEAAYCASKGGIIALTKTLAVEWAKHNICVNAIAPCDVETEMYHNWIRILGKGYADYARNRTPLSRVRGTIPQPDDVASAAVFLASDASNWITGHTLCVDGGSTTTEKTY